MPSQKVSSVPSRGRRGSSSVLMPHVGRPAMPRGTLLGCLEFLSCSFPSCVATIPVPRMQEWGPSWPPVPFVFCSASWGARLPRRPSAFPPSAALGRRGVLVTLVFPGRPRPRPVGLWGSVSCLSNGGEGLRDLDLPSGRPRGEITGTGVAL